MNLVINYKYLGSTYMAASGISPSQTVQVYFYRLYSIKTLVDFYNLE